MRDWLNSLLGQDGGRVAQFALALVTVVLLILLVFWVIRRLQPGARLVAATGGKARKRLGVLEASDVDTKRRLVLVRRDDVEHLIMIGGPNDLLIESRILRTGQGQAVNRPNVQQMPRPGANTDPDRYIPAVPTAPQTSPQPIIRAAPEPIEPVPSVQLAPAHSDEVPVVEPRLSSPMAPPPFIPQPFAPNASRVPAELIAPAPPTPPEPRRPSLNDLLSAATAAKAGDRRDLPQPIPVPPPTSRPKQSHPDLEEDDRELPTQVVAYRPPMPPQAPPASPPAHHMADQAVQAEAPPNRDTDVATQIERALSDLNPLMGLSDAPVRADTRPETVSAPRRPAPLPPSTSAPQSTTAPILRAPIATTMPPIPPRPIPPPRVSMPERVEAQPPAPVSQEPPHQVAELPIAAPLPISVAEPVTAPRPVTASLTRPLAAAAPDPAPQAPARQKTDELEEEMAKLLSELGGSPQR